MPAAIGFAILTYGDPHQIVRLTTRLCDLYGPDTPIALHHNFDQCRFDPAILPTGVRLVRPHRNTGWGSWETVEAALDAVRVVHELAAPEFTVLLSGTDYPVAPADRVLADLRTNGADAYLKASPVSPWRRTPAVPGPLGLGVNEGPANQKVCYRRYYPTTYRAFGFLRIRIRSPLLAPLLAPFSRELRCYAGEHWWTLGRRAVEHLLRSRAERPELARWFAERQIPEEGYVHTVVCNSGLRIDPRTFRYVDWSSRRPSPRALGTADLPAIREHGAHFARKFAPDDPALDEIDAALGLVPWRGAGRA